MSEEEKKRIEELKAVYSGAVQAGEVRIAEIIKNGIDLYNKEKEKNKELEELLEENTTRIAFENQDNYISKDKIREKIKDREHIIHNAKLKYGQDYEMYEDTIYARSEIELYKELLDE